MTSLSIFHFTPPADVWYITHPTMSTNQVPYRLVSFIAVLLSLHGAISANAQTNTNSAAIRTWKINPGRTLEARFVELQGNSVALATTNDARQLFAISSLSDADRTYLDTEAPVPLADRLAGRWFGTASIDGFIFQAQFTITKQGARLTAQGYMSRVLSKKEIADAMAKRLKKDKAQPFAVLVDQTWDVLLDGDSITFKGVQAKLAFGGADVTGSWTPDVFKGRFIVPGFATGAWKPVGKQKDGVFFFYKENALSKPLPLALETGKTHDLACLDDPRCHYSCYIPTNAPASSA